MWRIDAQYRTVSPVTPKKRSGAGGLVERKFLGPAIEVGVVGARVMELADGPRSSLNTAVPPTFGRRKQQYVQKGCPSQRQMILAAPRAGSTPIRRHSGVAVSLAAG